MDLKDKIDKVAGSAIKNLIKFCIAQKMENPIITMSAKTTDGESYRLVFEKIDVPERDSLFQDCAEFAKTKTKISCAMLQKKFLLGYMRGGRIMDQLEDAGIVGPFAGSKERKVLVSTDNNNKI